MGHLLIHSARQLVTLRGNPGPRRGPELKQLQIIEDGAVLIEDSRIREVGPTRRIENLAQARKAREINAVGRVVMPGFVDSHTHLLAGPPRLPPAGAAGDTPVPDARIPLLNIGAVRATSTRRLAAEAVPLLRQCLAHGTTTIEAKSGSALTSGGEIKLLRVLTTLGDLPIDVVPTCFGAHLVPPEFEGRAAEYVKWLIADLLPVISRRGLARFVDGCVDEGTFTADELRPYFERAHALGLALKLHTGQFGRADGAALAEAFPFTSIDHLEQADAGSLARVAAAGAVATLTPASSFFLHQRGAPARDLIVAGAPIAIASGFSRLTSPTFNMQMVVFLACHELGLSPAEALTAATVNGAHALKLGHRIGSLETGKQADLLILRAGDYRELAHEFGINLVGVTIKNGDVVFDNSGVKWPGRS